MSYSNCQRLAWRRVLEFAKKEKIRNISFKSKWQSTHEVANAEKAKTLKLERRVEFMLTRNLQRILERDKQTRDHEDTQMELLASLREIEALQTGLSPIEERLAAELHASNGRAASLQAQLANTTTSH